MGLLSGGVRAVDLAEAMNASDLAAMDLAVIVMAGVLIVWAVFEAFLGKGKRK